MWRAEPPAVARDPGGTPSDAPALPVPRFDHLTHMTEPLGLWEHAELTAPRVAHGFCTDDNARALIVVSRDATAAPGLDALAATYLGFVLDARGPDGRFRNRRDPDGGWADEVGSDDAQGRAWWSLGVVARHGRQPWMRQAGVAAFATCADVRSVHLRANAFAVLGAVELLAVVPDHGPANELLRRSVAPITDAAGSRIPWFEERLTYDNARLPEALLAAGAELHDPALVRTGLRLLHWLVEAETVGDHFSFTPARGSALGGPRPAFDQQPIEAVAMAEACQRAWTITGEAIWREHGLRAVHWFLGANDVGEALYDGGSGGTRDGLMVDGVNENQGAESTLAGLAALRVAAALGSDEPAGARR